MNNDNPAIEISNLGVWYGDRWIFRGFDLKVMAGERVSLTGPSGCGKSTVLKCVLGLAVAQEGRIRVLGKTVDGHGAWEVRRRVAFVAQEPELGQGTVEQVIARPFTYKVNVARRGNLERLPALLERFNLPKALLDKEVSTLSGGEKQRVALISAILLDRPIILLDEASSALDQGNKRSVAEFFQQASEVTVLSVSHDTAWPGLPCRVVNMAEHAQAQEETA